MRCYLPILRGLYLILLTGFVTMSSAQGLKQCPAGTQSCGTQNCCPYSQICSPDGYCYQQGQTYCGNGRICPRGQLCANNGLACAPLGSTACGPGVTCLPGTLCVSPGLCGSADGSDSLLHPNDPLNDNCQDGDGCLTPGWFRCEETGSQCRPGFKCSKIRGCVPLKAVDCGKARWCHPGEMCQKDGGCAPSSERPKQDKADSDGK
jgi:hypothetical protein